MLKTSIQKALYSININLFNKIKLNHYFHLTKINNIPSSCFYFKNNKRFTSNESSNIHSEEDKQTQPNKREKTKKPSTQTDLIVVEKKRKKKKVLKGKFEHEKKTEDGDIHIEEEAHETVEKNTAFDKRHQTPHETQEKITIEETQKTQEEPIKFKIPAKEDLDLLKKENYKKFVKESPKLNDLYKIKSSKLGEPNPRQFIDFSRIKNPNVTVKVYNKQLFEEEEPKENLIPCSPRLGPYVIDKPEFQSKTYHWCSCGMSKKQPFCDDSHSQTGFRPINFKLAEKCSSMMLCGCKLSKVAPFCDGATCIDLKKIEEEGIKNILQNLDNLKNTEKLSQKILKTNIKKIPDVLDNNENLKPLI